MIILFGSTTPDVLQVTCGTSVASVECHCSWVSDNAGTMTPGNTNTTITSSTAATTVHTAVTTGYYVNIKGLTIRNVSATPTLITISHTINGGTPVVMFTVTLAQNQTIQYFDTTGFQVVNSSGAAMAAVVNPTLSTTAGAVLNSQFPQGLVNFNTAAQSQVVVSGTAYYIAGSNLNLPATLINGIAVGTTLRWRVAMNKTNAGTGAFNIVIYMGTNGSVSDTAEVSQSVGTQSAAADTMLVDVQLTFTAVGSSTGSFFWSISALHSALVTATGFGLAVATQQWSGTVSSLNTTTGSLIFGLGFISTTGTPTIGIPLVEAQAFNLD